ncbi:MAG: hypothetical protein FJ138_11455 [Deltaproteobacteria bacterium]|nr:hypothetical protein [Deltaproteobacteria bacterium]
MSVLIAILGFGLLIFVHELGHFLFARLTGMTVEVFSIGFGPTLYSVQRGDTVYQLALLPFGGYVRVKGLAPKEEPPPARTLGDVEREWGLEEGAFEASDELKARLEGGAPAPAPEDPAGSYQSKPLWARALMVGGGPLFNVLFTVGAFWALLATGQALSVLEVRSPSLTFQEVSGAAAAAGVRAGDVLLAIDGEAVSSFGELKRRTVGSEGREMRLSLARPPAGVAAPVREERVVDLCLRPESALSAAAGDARAADCARFEGVTRYRQGAEESWERLTVAVTPARRGEAYLLGLTPALDRFGGDGVGRSLALAARESAGLIESMYEQLAGALRGTERVEVASVVKITAISADTVKMGGEWFLNFLAFLSLNLAVLNLLPFPALDGGRLIFLAIEAVSRRPVPPRVEMLVHAFGVVLLVGLTAWVTLKDILSLL